MNEVAGTIDIATLGRAVTLLRMNKVEGPYTCYMTLQTAVDLGRVDRRHLTKRLRRIVGRYIRRHK